MSKPFEVVYTAEQFNSESNELVSVAWGGINVQAPPNSIGPRYSPSIDDFLIRNGEIRSRPQLTTINGPDTGKILALIPGWNPTGVANNLAAVTDSGLYYLDNAGTWHFVANPAYTVQAGPVTWRIFNSVLYMSQIGNALPTTCSWDGVNAGTFNGNAAIVAGNPIAGRYLDELDQHLILADVVDGGTPFTFRIRWSAIGLPNVWDATINVNAGSNDFIEVPTEITGLMMMGRVGYIFRTNGITEMAPTGIGTAPFEFNHLWASKTGIGNVLPFSIGQYGFVGGFVSADDVYALIGHTPQRVGGVARDAIFKDMASPDVSSPAIPPVVGIITPYLWSYVGTNVITANDKAQMAFAYVLLMRTSGQLRMWLYDLEERHWTRWNLGNYSCWGGPAVGQYGQTTSQNALLIPLNPSAGGTNKIGVFTPGNYNTEVASQYTFRMEDIAESRVPTVRRVVITYKDIATCPITVTVSGTNDNAQVVSSSQNVTLGSGTNTNNLMTKFVDITLTAFRPQIQITRAANAGSLAITKVMMVGTVEDRVTL